MKKIRHLISSGLTSIATFLFFMNWIGALFLHLFTVSFAFKTSGILSALVSLIMPIIAQIYWFIKMWNITGHFSNEFSFNVLVYLGWAPIPFILMFIAILVENKEK